MKTLVMLAVIGALGYFGYGRLIAPKSIPDPVFAEIRVDIKSGGREIEAAIFGKTSDTGDCHDRTEKVRSHLRANCPECQLKSSECKTTLAARYAKFFDDQPSHATYLSLDRSNPWERDVRLIFWGLTGSEGDTICEHMRQMFLKIHSGPTRCIRGVASS